MPLLVKYTNNGTGYITKYELDSLIASGEIVSFKRSNGEWVYPEIGPLRNRTTSFDYRGPERRSRF